MKLYTEEQVNEIFNRVKMISDEHKHEHIINHLSKDLTPIELPSDEEIKEAANKQWGNVHRTGVLGFIDCAKWIKEQILNQNK